MGFRFFWAFPFLKKKGPGLEFILSEVEGGQSFLNRKGFTRNLSRAFVEGIPNAKFYNEREFSID
jgi:hypothetical protein